MEPKLTFNKIYHHFRTIQIHRRWVRRYCRWAGIPWRGLIHDFSKYSPTEFIESARYWTGYSSPIIGAKTHQGYSRAWLHHRGHNSHHWAYWVDNFSEGPIVYPMPKDDFVEMVCDFLAAAHAYDPIEFSYAREKEWWGRDKQHNNKAMHPCNKRMLDIIFSDLAFAENHTLEGCPTSLIMTPKELIKSGYLQEIWRANNEKNPYPIKWPADATITI